MAILLGGANLALVGGGGGGGGDPTIYFTGGSVNEMWWPTDNAATLFQGLSSETGAVTDGDPVGTVTKSSGGSPYVFSDSNPNRPTWNEADGGLDMTGGQRIITTVGTPRGSDMYVAAVLKTTDTQFAFINGNSSGNYAGLCIDGNGSTAWYAGAGTPTIEVNGVNQVSPTLDSLHAAIATGSKVLVEIIGLDMSAFAWGYTYFGLPVGLGLYTGQYADIYLAENTADVRANVPGIIAARHGITL